MGSLGMLPGKSLGETVKTARGQTFVWTAAGWLWIPRR
jgi:hypothetical protein